MAKVSGRRDAKIPHVQRCKTIKSFTRGIAFMTTKSLNFVPEENTLLLESVVRIILITQNPKPKTQNPKPKT